MRARDRFLPCRWLPGDHVAAVDHQFRDEFTSRDLGTIVGPRDAPCLSAATREGGLLLLRLHQLLELFEILVKAPIDDFPRLRL